MNETHYSQLGESVFSKTLSNGLKVFLYPKKEMAKTFGIFSTDYGSIDQSFIPRGEKDFITVPDGIAHFLEHKLFEKEDRDVFQDFTKLGASANAFTSFTSTAYLFSATSNIKENVETLLNFVQDPYFSEESVEKEKGIIGQEIRMYDDQPDWRAFFGTLQSLYQNHPVKVDIAGTVESINEITKDDLYTCYHTFYHPSNMTFFLAGNFEAEEMMAYIEENQNSKAFEKPAEVERYFPEEPVEAAEKKKVIEMPVSTPKCMVAVKESTSNKSAEELIRADLITDILLDLFFSKSGSFYETLYKEDLIDHTFQYETTIEKNFGFSVIGSNTPEPDKLQEKLQEMLLSMKNIKLDEKEFNRVKKKQIGQLLRAFNSLEFISTQFIHYHLLGADLFELLSQIEAVTVHDAQQFMEDWISPEKIAVCQVVPVKG